MELVLEQTQQGTSYEVSEYIKMDVEVPGPSRLTRFLAACSYSTDVYKDIMKAQRKFIRNHVLTLLQKPRCQHSVKTQKMQDSNDRFFKGNISSPRSNRSSSNFGKGKKKQDGANGVYNNKMSFIVQHHNRKDRNEKPRSKNAKEAFTINHEHSDRYVMMGTTLTTNCKQLLADVLQENKEVFAWTRSERTTVLRFIMEHQLKIYPLAKPVVHKRQPMASEGRLEGEELASLMGYPYKSFLSLSKEHSQIRMAEDVEEKIGFHTEEGVYCFTHMPKELKKLRCYTLEDDGKGLNRSKRTERGNIVRRNSNKKQKGQVKEAPDANKGGMFDLSKGFQANSIPTTRAWRLYLCREKIKEGSGVGIILTSPEEKMYLYAIRLRFKASNHAMDYEALLVGLAASANQGMKDLHIFIDSLTLVTQVLNHTSPKNLEPKSISADSAGNYKARIPQPGSIG
nr:hypothetical protein [Tanacetum cinerariifolium]